MKKTPQESLAARSPRLFQDMTPRKWMNLAVAGLAVFYLLQIILDFMWGTMCGHVGVDYCNNIWSIGHIANTMGYAKIYDIDLIARVERSIFPANVDPSLFIVTPPPYLAIFVPPFQLFALLSPTAGYLLWTALNLAVMIVYLLFFGRSLSGQAPEVRLLMITGVSLPLFFNVFYGNVNVWLLICTGEFMRAFMSDKPIRSGLWLGGLMLKPPLLLMIGFFLLMSRAFRVLAGAAAASGLLAGLSLLLVGPQAFAKMIGIWLRSAAGQPSDGVESMMNWRMLGVDLSHFTGQWLAWTVAALGILLTLVFTVRALRPGLQRSTQSFSLTTLAILTASSALAWHSHVHTALVLLPPIVLLYQRKILPQPVLDTWVLLPASIFVLVLIPQHLMRVGLLPESAQYLVYLMRGGGALAANIYLLWWAVRTSHREPVPA